MTRTGSPGPNKANQLISYLINHNGPGVSNTDSSHFSKFSFSYWFSVFKDSQSVPHSKVSALTIRTVHPCTKR